VSGLFLGRPGHVVQFAETVFEKIVHGYFKKGVCLPKLIILIWLYLSKKTPGENILQEFVVLCFKSTKLT